MANPPSSKALAKRPSDTSLMPPPPPPKRIKRPATVLDEDDYTSALSDIIARDFFPGLRETQAQQEYLNALESDDQAWISEAGRELREAMTPLPSGSRRRAAARNSRFGTPMTTPLPSSSATPTPGATPRGWTGASGDAIPTSVAFNSAFAQTPESTAKPQIQTSTLSLSAFHAKYTSEDNESFNALLDKQNENRRKRHAYLWTQDNEIPSSRQLAHRAREEARLLTQQKAEDAAANDDDDGGSKALVPLTTGATDNRPAKPDSWQIKRPNNAFMFHASSVDEDGIQTVAEARAAASRAGPKGLNYGNTRFAPQALADDDASSVPPSPSLSAVIARRVVARSETEYSGGETPRVNGYAFVEEDEPGNLPEEESAAEPTYRDLLAGQVGDATPNPFKINEMRRREDLHHRMVEKVAKKKRARDGDVVRGTPVGGSCGGGLTPAAQRLLDKMGKTPVAGSAGGSLAGVSGSRNMWTPTPRRKGTVSSRVN